MVRRMIGFFSFLLVISGCASSPEQLATRTATAETAIASMWTSTWTATSTKTPTSTITPTATRTSTPTLTGTVTNTPEPQCVPGETIFDLDEEVELLGHVNIIQVSTELKRKTLKVVFTLQDVPETLLFNRAHTTSNAREYEWAVMVDVDNDVTTGWQGTDYEISISKYKFPAATAVRDTIRHACQKNVWESMPDGNMKSRTDSIMIKVDPDANTISMEGTIPGIREDSHLTFKTFDFNGGSPQEDYICNIDLE